MAGYVPDPLELLALCTRAESWMALLAALTSGGGIVAALFVAGLVSGFTHCAGMCGPFVLMRAVDTAEETSAWGRIGRATLWRYHLGRATTYAAVGAGTAAAADAALNWAGLRWLLVALLVAVAAALVLRTVRGTTLVTAPGVVSHGISRFIARAGRLGDFPLGLALGFLPCGVLYGALAAAASTGNVWTGAAAMAAFALGTAPGLIAVGLGGAFFARRFRHARLAIVPLLALNIAILTAFALKAVA